MKSFLLSLGLLLMIPPALFSVLFASRSLVWMIWNLTWYWIIGEVVESLFSSPHAGMVVTVFLSALYVRKAVFSPANTMRFDVRTMRPPFSAEKRNTKNVRQDYRGHSSGSTSKTQDEVLDNTVIDVEATREKGSLHD